MKVSIIMLVHNAPQYVKESIDTLHTTEGVDYELVVVDNASNLYTKHILKKYKKCGKIDKLVLNEKNLLFAGGNNKGALFADECSDYFLLLNSDIRINNSGWLKKLVDLHKHDVGISAYGVVFSEPVRADGYCFLINRNLYMKYMLDENYQWFWGITKIQSQVLKEGKRIVAVANHEDLIHHYGGKSGKAYKKAKGLDADIEIIKSWFSVGKVEVRDSISIQDIDVE